MKYRIIKDKVAGGVMTFFTLLSLILLVAMAVGLWLKSADILEEHSMWNLLTASEWKPMRNQFGFLAFISGTFYVTGVATVIALPTSLLMAIFLTEYSRSTVRRYIYPLLDILASLPSVIFGVWGTLVIVPIVSDIIGPAVGTATSGYTLLSGAVVLSVMILPLLVSLFIEILGNVEIDLREASLALGATRWQTTKHVVLKKGLPGIIASTVLAISRALGETIAVLMVCGNLIIIPDSLLDACYPIPALIANNYGEMLSLPLYESALMFAAFILFFIVLVFNLGARLYLKTIKTE
ncbi:MAG: phosphate ABC transporter permease subunit PstC [Paludibacteraceae bacterium]|jgi:phosphate transport system permease protein|nr:phosphate ABC transporter permease subunit PstC [Paludibacteraceae bacterium]MBR6110441.1 phosphate ABC transporter permease subunit PstC [Paludibacteraceae bacterium]MBS7363961.1 phosphate ABC transporter permease subunit PstC [Paludibacteraceae bacterium]MEE1175802.1 phosphate ABC transporter permease subunit PstC [Paludibacteraceae bacterium]